jgi:DivIVA domain-containing protein
VELDRHFIERNDFQAVRRGYDPEEVDKHLADIAEAVAELKRQAKRSPSSLAQQAAEQVRGIVEAAERSASEITGGAEDEARRITDDAAERARETREKADRDALDRVQAAEDATQSVLDRSNAVKAEIDRMLEDARAAANSLADNLRTSAGSLQGELDAIRGELQSVRDGRLEEEPAGPPASSRPSAVSTPALEPSAVDLGDDDDDDDDLDAGPVDAEPEVIEEVEETTVEVGSANGDLETVDEIDDEVEEEDEEEVADEAPASTGRSIRGAEGARLIALNMALNGTPRDETARYLSQNFDLDDQDALLDEVEAPDDV